jgi:malonate-semialdehyde dehydrogenase (acetylating)/methylmalonate-semialdehyde dehydrogenase
MAISVAVAVGDHTAEELIRALVLRIEGLRVGPSTDASADFGPLITQAHLQKVKQYVEMGVREGAKLVLDGRDFKLRGYEGGFLHGSMPLR